METDTNTTPKPETLLLTRVFDAPPERVWNAWTDPDQLMRWWGPKDFTSPAARIDLREGGTYLFCMRTPDGNDMWSTGTYREIKPHERIFCTDSFADAEGNIVPATHYGMGADWPEELQFTLAFEAKDGKTRFTLQHAGIPGESMRDMCAQGWNESLDKLAAVLAGDR